MLHLISNLLEQSFLFSLVTIGIFLSFRIIDFPDLTVDGSFTLGASVYAIGVIHGWNSFGFLMTAGIAGAIAGGITALLHTKLGINKIVSGLLMMIMLYSVNLTIMGRSNIALSNTDSVFDHIRALFGDVPLTEVWTLLVIMIMFQLLLYYLLITDRGTLMRALGDSEPFVKSLAVDTDKLKIGALAIANGIIAFAGALVAQNQGFADVNMGFGVIIIGFAALVIGEAIFGNRNLKLRIIGTGLGTLCYFSVISFAIRIGVAPSLTRLITGLLIIVLLFTMGLSKSRNNFTAFKLFIK